MIVILRNIKWLCFLTITLFIKTSYAEFNHDTGCWTDGDIHILMPGTSQTVYVDRENRLDPMMRGDYLLSRYSTRMGCATEADAKAASLHVHAVSVVSAGASEYGTDMGGNPAVQFPEGGLGIEMYLSTDEGTENFFASEMPVSANFPASTDFTVNLGLYLVSTTGGAITAGVHHFSGWYGDIVAGNTIEIGLSDFTVDVVLTSCKITTPSTVSMKWDSVSSREIVDGTVDPRRVDVGIYCGEIETPISISFASSNGFVNAAEGIVKTSTEDNNLGLQLRWESTGLPIAMDRKTTDTLLGNKDYNITGKPVPINASQPIKSGEFTGNVTMMFAYR